MPISWRLTFWFSLTLFVILLISGTVIYILLQSYLNNDVDENLRFYASKVHGTLNPQPDTLDFNVIHAHLPPINQFASPTVYIEVIDRTGKVLVKSDNLGELELPVNPALADKGFRGDVGIDTVPAGHDARVRILVSPLYMNDQTLLLQVGQSLQPIESVMTQVRWALVAGIVAALALSVVSGAAVLRRAFAPVKSITEIAQRIESSADLSQRVGYKGPMDEIGGLANTFDHMIEHLDKVFNSQRRFVADASHELRGPLTVLRGNLDLLKRNMGEDDRQESFRAMRSEVERMSRIVNDLLLLAEVETTRMEKRETVSLKEVLLDGYARAQQLAGNREVVIARQEDLIVKGDFEALSRLLSNLLSNAIRYTAEDGKITLSLFREDGWARLEVADNGIGIEADHLAHIFEPFYRVDKARSRAKGGSGLGLAIVKGIAEQHGGNVSVESEAGKGSKFTLALKL